MARLALARVVLLAAVGASTTCIIPDREIGFAGGPENPGAVRILVRPPMLQEMEDFCNADPVQDADLRFCPAAWPNQPQGPTRPPGLISAGPDSPFCICQSGRDNRAIDTFSIFAEDPDAVQDLPADTLYGVLLLDPDVDSETPTDAVAYGNYLEPGGGGHYNDRPVRGDAPRAVPSEERDEVFQWIFFLDDGSGRGTIDLCNDDNGDAPPAGLHTLQFMVTDRPFFRPQIFDEVENDNGDIERKPRIINGEPVYGPRQYGVPDLAAGATYAVTEWVFECRLAGEETDPAGECDCAGEVG